MRSRKPAASSSAPTRALPAAASAGQGAGALGHDGDTHKVDQAAGGVAAAAAAAAVLMRKAAASSTSAAAATRSNSNSTSSNSSSSSSSTSSGGGGGGGGGASSGGGSGGVTSSGGVAGSSGGSAQAAVAAAGPPAAASAPPQSAVEQRMAQLRELQAASSQALAQRPAVAADAHLRTAPRLVDARMYDQLVRVHNKLTREMGAQEAFVVALQEEVSRCNDDLMAAHELLKQIAMEFGTTKRLAQSAAAAVQFGVDADAAVTKVEKLTQRLAAMEEAVLQQRDQFGSKVVRRVPVEWVGCANEVVLMGDFDGWTRGQELSAEDVTSDSVYARFEGTLLLRPGRYLVKLLVDGEWRLAADWPKELDGGGNEVNVLTVE